MSSSSCFSWLVLLCWAWVALVLRTLAPPVAAFARPFSVLLPSDRAMKRNHVFHCFWNRLAQGVVSSRPPFARSAGEKRLQLPKILPTCIWFLWMRISWRSELCSNLRPPFVATKHIIRKSRHEASSMLLLGVLICRQSQTFGPCLLLRFSYVLFRLQSIFERKSSIEYSLSVVNPTK